MRQVKFLLALQGFNSIGFSSLHNVFGRKKTWFRWKTYLCLPKWSIKPVSSSFLTEFEISPWKSDFYRPTPFPLEFPEPLTPPPPPPLWNFQFPLWWGMDIFWNHTLCSSCRLSLHDFFFFANGKKFFKKGIILWPLACHIKCRWSVTCCFRKISTAMQFCWKKYFSRCRKIMLHFLWCLSSACYMMWTWSVTCLVI